MQARGLTEPFDIGQPQRVIDQHGVPGALRQQGLGDVGVGKHAGLSAPALQPPRGQRGLDALWRDQHDRLAGEIGHREGRLFAVGGSERDRHFECRAGARLALQRDAAAHALDDAVGDAQAEASSAIAVGDLVVGLLELAKNPLARLGRDADAGVAHQKADFIGPDAGLDDQGDAAGRGELDGIAGEIEQHLPQPRRVADHVRRQPLVDIGGNFDLLGLRARREQFGDVLDHA